MAAALVIANFFRHRDAARMRLIVEPISASSSPTPGRDGRPPGGRLTEADAVEIWVARWLRVRRKELCRRYGCDPRRLYEIWSEERFPGSRGKALAQFEERFPGLLERVDVGRHRRISRAVPPSQLSLFEAGSTALGVEKRKKNKD